MHGLGDGGPGAHLCVGVDPGSLDVSLGHAADVSGLGDDQPRFSPLGGVGGSEGGGTVSSIVGSAARERRHDNAIGNLDPAKAAKTYARLYPLFQNAYEELGYPGRYFNDRLIAVIDHLLQAPEPAGPVQVRLVEVKGNVSSQRPWVRYEYVDPKLESLSSGQKIMVRVGPENERKLKASLRGFREQIATGEMTKTKQR